MTDYSKSYNGAAKDLSTDLILGADFDTEFQAIETAIGTKANKKIPAAVGNVATLDSAGDLQDSGVTSTELGILDGATVTTAELNTLDGITATVNELNILDGVTATAAEINTLDGITATVTELNYTSGVTSAIQTQLDAITTSIDPLGTVTISSPTLYATFQDGVSGVTFDGTYDQYIVVMDNVVPDTDNVTLRARVFVGAVFQTGTVYGTAGATVAFMTLSGAVGSAAGEGLDGEVKIAKPTSTTQYKRFFSNIAYTDISGAPAYSGLADQYTVAANAIDGFSLYFDSGNIESGTFYLYGVRK